MTRLIYDGLRAELDGNLTSSTTTINFVASLRHSGGTAVPTLAGGDYIPLVLLDASGDLREIVHLTAYTSGATSGTISRGQESTAGVTHADAATVVCSVLVTDLTPTVDLTPDATTSVKGKVELSTDVEANDGTDATRAVTPHGLAYTIARIAYVEASTSRTGVVELADDSEAVDGIDDSRAVTPHSLAAAIALRDGSRIDNVSDPLWGTSLGYDLDFNDDDLSGTLPSGWGWHNQGSAAYRQAWGAGIIHHAGQAVFGQDDLKVLSRSTSGFPSTWQMFCKLSLASTGVPFATAGLVLRGANNKLISFHRTNNGSHDIIQWTTEANGFDGAVLSATTASIPADSYISIRKNSSTSYDCLWSPDGIIWTNLLNFNPQAYLTSIAEVGFVLNNTSNFQAFEAAFKWFRVR
jgi:hypothetical protein